MSPDPQRDALWRELDAMRRGAEPIEPREVAGRAIGAGLSADAALEAVRIYTEFRGRQAAGELTPALSVFISTICEKRRSAGQVLEYTCLPLLLTASLVSGDSDTRVSAITPNARVEEVLNVVLRASEGQVLASAAALPGDARFETIVCLPPLGQRSSADERADGFGGEVVLDLAPFVADDGIAIWVTSRGALARGRASRTLSALEAQGLFVSGRVDTAPGAFPGTVIEGAIVVLGRSRPDKIFVATLRDVESAVSTAGAMLKGPTQKPGPNWIWLDPDDERTFSELEQARLLEKLLPRGRFELKPLSELLISQVVAKADREVEEHAEATAFLFVPEYAGSRVTTDLEEQTVKPRAVYRLAVDPERANSRFLAHVLNGPFGREARRKAASGATIQRVSQRALLGVEVPVPPLATQEQIARIQGDIGLLRAVLLDVGATIDQDWAALEDVSERVEALKGVLDVEKQIAEWWRELPYPLATIYRRYQVSTNPKERLETLLHFFEMAAVYLAAVGTSHVRSLRADWKEAYGKWLHPEGAAGIERADFGFWIKLAGASLKDVKRSCSDQELRQPAVERAGHEFVQGAAVVGSLSKATEVLDVARRYRNSWKGHGGHLKGTDAARLVVELEQAVREFYELTAPIFRRLLLVRPGKAEVADGVMRFEVETLLGSDPTFSRDFVELDRPANSDSLAFWLRDSRAMCQAVPFFRMGVPQEPQETSCYVFNRVENGGVRWISYQEAREQEFVAPDEELLGLIALGREVA